MDIENNKLTPTSFLELDGKVIRGREDLKGMNTDY